MIKYFIPAFLIFLLHLQVIGQTLKSTAGNPLLFNAPAEKQSAETGSDKITDLYFKSLSFRNEIINGKEYVVYYYRSKTTPLLFSNLAFRSTVEFDGRVYKNVKLQYDMFLDYVIYTDSTKLLNFEFPRIALYKDLLPYFSFRYNNENYHFRLLKFPEAMKGNPGDGYYEIVYEGPSIFIIRHRATEYFKDAVTEYKYSTLKYILMDGTFRRFTNMKEFLALFGPKEEDIRTFIKTNRIRIRKANKEEIASILKYYDTSIQK